MTDMNKFDKKLGMSPNQWLKLIDKMKKTPFKSHGNSMTIREFMGK